MNATASPLARIAGVAIVLILAAAVGLMAGNALNARDAGPAGGPGPFPNVWGNHAAIDAAAGAPSYADPFRGHIQEGAAAAVRSTGIRRSVSTAHPAGRGERRRPDHLRELGKRRRDVARGEPDRPHACADPPPTRPEAPRANRGAFGCTG